MEGLLIPLFYSLDMPDESSIQSKCVHAQTHTKRQWIRITICVLQKISLQRKHNETEI